MENCILYDWLTVSFQNVNQQDLIQVLGLSRCPWDDQGTGSRLKYGHRMSFDGVSVHWSDGWDTRHNVGCCLEMSGQGCRDFETYGSGDWNMLFEFIALAGGRVTRLDIAYDDFSGVLPIKIIGGMADSFYFTARTQHVRTMRDSDDGDPDHVGLSICHGSKSSEVYIRIYDKRAEKHAWIDFPHWVRCEVQLRGSNAQGFLSAAGSIGDRFRGVLSNYLLYRCPAEDSNKRRWAVAPFWDKFLESAAALSVHQTRDVEYNKDRLDRHIYGRNYNSLRSEILIDGLPVFLDKVFGHTEELPPKYATLCKAAQNSDEILQILGETTTTGQIQQLQQQLADYSDFHAFNAV